MTDDLFTDADVIFSYTIDQATRDGILVDLRQINPAWEKGLFSHVTTNLLATCGSLNEDRTLNSDGSEQAMPNLVDLLNQSLQIVRRAAGEDWFYSGAIELPSGERQEIFIVQNETGKFTLMIPADY